MHQDGTPRRMRRRRSVDQKCHCLLSRAAVAAARISKPYRHTHTHKRRLTGSQGV